MTVRDWLRRNGYDDVAALIDEVLVEFKITGARSDETGLTSSPVARMASQPLSPAENFLS